MLLISRVGIVSMILPVVLSTVSNLLVGQFVLVEFSLILLSFRPLLWRKINVHVSEPSSIIGASYLVNGW